MELPLAPVVIVSTEIAQLDTPPLAEIRNRNVPNIAK